MYNYVFLDPLQSPGPSAVDTFQSPVMSNQVKKNLFPPMIKPGQTVFHGKPFTLGLLIYICFKLT